MDKNSTEIVDVQDGDLTRWSEHSHLVSVNAVVVEEMSRLLVDLSRTILITPEVEETLVHRPRTKARHLSQVT